MKSAVVLGLALALGVTRGDALRLSLALAQCGEFGFVLFGAAQVGGLMTAERVALASVIITISMLATPFFVRLGDRLQPLAGYGKSRSVLFSEQSVPLSVEVTH